MLECGSWVANYPALSGSGRSSQVLSCRLWCDVTGSSGLLSNVNLTAASAALIERRRSVVCSPLCRSPRQKTLWWIVSRVLLHFRPLPRSSDYSLVGRAEMKCELCCVTSMLSGQIALQYCRIESRQSWQCVLFIVVCLSRSIQQYVRGLQSRGMCIHTTRRLRCSTVWTAVGASVTGSSYSALCLCQELHVKKYGYDRKIQWNDEFGHD